MWRLIGTVAAVVALVAAVAGGLWKAHDLGAEAGKAEMAVVLADWKASVERQSAERRESQRERLAQLQGELDELRSRPEKVRTVTRTIRLKPDAECASLSADYRRLWNAGYESGVRMGASSAATGLDHAGRVALADAGDAVRDAKHAYERNTAALNAAQLYITNVCTAKEPPK